MTFGNIITEFPETQNVISDTEIYVFMFIASQAVMYSCDIFTHFGGYFVFEFCVGKTESSLAWGRFGISISELCKNNCMTNYTKNALQTLRMHYFEKWALTINKMSFWGSGFPYEVGCSLELLIVGVLPKLGGPEYLCTFF